MVTYYENSWPAPCQHRLYKDRSGAVIHPLLLENGANIIKVQGQGFCAACADPDGMHPDHATVPRRPGAVVGGFNLNPATANFEPRPQALVVAPQMPMPAETIEHKAGKPCPSRDPHCHFHHSVEVACHIPWLDCSMAKKASAASFHAKSAWKGSPPGWDQAHADCLVPGPSNNRCPFHTKLYVEAQPVSLNPRR